MGNTKVILEALEPHRLLAAGALDPFFGNGGNASGNFFDTETVPFVAGLPAGKVLAAGTYNGSDGSDRFIVARFNDDGSPDTTFGSGGAVFDELPGGDIYYGGAALQPDQKLLVAGEYSGHKNFQPVPMAPIVVRYLPDGTLDPMFGVGGIVTDSRFDEILADPVVLPDGKILVSAQGNGHQSATGAGVLKLNPDGSPDDTFGDHGFVSEKFDSFYDSDTLIFKEYQPGPLVPLPDGSVVLAGRVDTGNNDEFAEFYQSLFLIKFDASGKLDKTFGRTGDGLSDPTHFGGEEPPHSALLTTDGKIVVSTGFSPHQVAMSRFTTAGLLDETFGDRGTVHVVIDKLAGRDAVSNVLQQGDGKLLLAGGSADAAPLVKLMRFNGTDGSPDLTFGHAGATKIPLDQDLGLAVALGFSSDGSILMGRSAGHFVEDDHHILVSRFWRDEAPVANYVPHNRSSGGTTALRFTIAWRDDDGVDASSIDNGDVQIITPGGAKLRAIVEGRQMLNGQLVVTYKMKPPGGTWRSSANGRYTVRLLSNRVADTAGNFTRGRTLGTFRVRVS